MKEKLNLKDIIFFLIVLLMALGCIFGKLYSDNKDRQTAAQLNLERVAGVHVKGEVKKAGYYELPYDSRVKDAIEAAGGITKEGDVNSVNLAEHLTDGEEIVVLKKSSGSREQSKININTASEEILCTIDGIGEKTAQNIISYREKSGGFKSEKDLLKVEGMNKSKFEKVKEYITLE